MPEFVDSTVVAAAVADLSIKTHRECSLRFTSWKVGKSSQASSLSGLLETLACFRTHGGNPLCLGVVTRTYYTFTTQVVERFSWVINSKPCINLKSSCGDQDLHAYRSSSRELLRATCAHDLFKCLIEFQTVCSSNNLLRKATRYEMHTSYHNALVQVQYLASHCTCCCCRDIVFSELVDSSLKFHY